MNECPHCGGKNGVNYTAKLVTTRLTSWDRKEDEEVNCLEGVFAKYGKCMDCGKRVKVPVKE